MKAFRAGGYNKQTKVSSDYPQSTQLFEAPDSRR